MYKIPKNFAGKPERSVMTDVDWQTKIDVIGTKPFASNTIESKIAVAANILSESARKLRALYYREVVEPKYGLGVKINTLAEQQAARFEAIATSLEGKDHEFYMEEIARLRSLAQRIRGKASAPERGI